ncbi:hypothetical protein ABPG72_004054 [Tetrahymena utriculariae]
MNIQQNQLQDPPHNSSHYGKIEYWEKRYQTNTKPFDWYQNYDGVKDIITQYINKSTRILNVGCGSSLLSEEMYFEGYKNITNVDYSNNLIKHLIERYSEGFENTFKFEHCDVRNMKGKFANNSFDCVIDKGTLDSVLCGEYSRQNSFKMLSEISRVLSQDGVYIVVTYGEEKKRQQLLENPEFMWHVKKVYKIYKPNVQSISENLFDYKDPDNYHYIYICKKGDQVLTPRGKLGNLFKNN